VLIRYFGDELLIVIDFSVAVIGESCFQACYSVVSIRFTADSHMSRVDDRAFTDTPLTAFSLPIQSPSFLFILPPFAIVPTRQTLIYLKHFPDGCCSSLDHVGISNLPLFREIRAYVGIGVT
jgi:hypothetical protein